MRISAVCNRRTYYISWLYDFGDELLVIDFDCADFGLMGSAYLTVGTDERTFFIAVVVKVDFGVSFVGKIVHVLNIFYRIWIGRYWTYCQRHRRKSILKRWLSMLLWLDTVGKLCPIRRSLLLVNSFLRIYSFQHKNPINLWILWLIWSTGVRLSILILRRWLREWLLIWRTNSLLFWSKQCKR